METERGFFKILRTKQTLELMKDPKAWTLFSLIAYRAKRTNEASIYGLKIGEALIGDYKSCGLSEKEYRNAKKRLAKMGLAVFKGANKGTVATLINTDIFDINAEDGGEQKGGQGASKGRTRGGQGASKKKEKNEKKEKSEEVKSQDARPAPHEAGGLSVKKDKEPMPDYVKNVLRLKTIPKEIDEEKRIEELKRQGLQLQNLKA
jgi:hypothetical protein